MELLENQNFSNVEILTENSPQKPFKVVGYGELDKMAKALDMKRRRFAENYCRVFNKTKAAIMAGYSVQQAGNAGCMMYLDPQVREYIDALSTVLSGSATDNIARIENIANGNLTDYMRPVKRSRSDRIQVPISEYIRSLEQDLRIEYKYFEDYCTTKTELLSQQSVINDLKRMIGKARIEQAINPAKKIIMNSEEYLFTDMEIDLVKVAADKQHARVKKIKQRDDGSLEVELCNPLEAEQMLARVHGNFEKDKTPININLNEINIEFR
jgi:hypothetical protein